MNRRASDEHTTGADTRSQSVLDEEGRRAGEAGREQLQAGTGRAAAGVGDFAEAVGSAADRLGELHHEGLAEYANRLSSQLSDVSDRLRSKSIDELADDVRRLAERNPALFLLGAVAVGVGLSRFAKASARDRRNGIGGEMAWREPGTGEEPAPADYTSRERLVFPERAMERASPDSPDRPETPDSTGGTGL